MDYLHYSKIYKHAAALNSLYKPSSLEYARTRQTMDAVNASLQQTIDGRMLMDRVIPAETGTFNKHARGNARRIGREWYIASTPLKCGHRMRTTKNNKCHTCQTKVD